MQSTKIPWCDYTANPIKVTRTDTGKLGHHCEKCSPGCDNCFAARWNQRMLPGGGTGYPFLRQYRPRVSVCLDVREFWHVQNAEHIHRRCVFLGDMTDLFGSWISDQQLHHIAALMRDRMDVMFVMMTKRADRMARFFTRYARRYQQPNIVLGVSVENRKTVRNRLPYLRDLAAAGYRTAVSAAPVLESFSLRSYATAIHWLVVAGESGDTARRCDVEWLQRIVRSVGSQCRVFVSQLGSNPYYRQQPVPVTEYKGNNPAEWPAGIVFPRQTLLQDIFPQGL